LFLGSRYSHSPNSRARRKPVVGYKEPLFVGRLRDHVPDRVKLHRVTEIAFRRGSVLAKRQSGLRVAGELPSLRQVCIFDGLMRKFFFSLAQQKVY